MRLKMISKLTTTIVALLTMLASFFAPIQIILYVIIVVVMFDLLTAIMKAFKNTTNVKPFKKRLSVIKSHKLRRTGLKLFFYLGIVMMVYGAEIAIFSRTLYITNAMAVIFIFVELASICENADIIMETSIFVKAIKKIRRMFETKIEEKIKGGETGEKTDEPQN